MKYPKALKSGDYIGVTAPSAGINEEIKIKRLENAEKNLRKKGFNYIETSNVRKEEKGRSSSAKERAKQFMDLWNNEKVGAIISATGGDFMSEILDELDFEEIKKSEPKWFQGYSDNTVLTFELPLLADTACIYGPTIKDFGMRNLHRSLEDSLKIMEGNEITQERFEKFESR